jgi:hypothetical protein
VRAARGSGRLRLPACQFSARENRQSDYEVQK